MNIFRVFLLPLLLIASFAALAQDARERGFIRRGMSEGEVLVRVGKPDHESVVSNNALRGLPEEKTWTYFPHPQDPETLTVISFRSGVVVEIERKISR
jgi:hypothetical protein